MSMCKKWPLLVILGVVFTVKHKLAVLAEFRASGNLKQVARTQDRSKKSSLLDF